ncbi:MAG: hypothetical protein AAF222_14785 [Pseudomonadota bacterium]
METITESAMNAFSRISRTITGDTSPLLEQIETPWGFRLRPANMEEKASDLIIEWGLTLLGIALLVSAFAQWLLPSSLYVGNGLVAKLVLTCVLGMLGGLCLAVSARGFRPEVQVDRSRHEIRFVSRNPRGRGQVLATVDIDQIIGVGITRSLATGDCHCLIYLIDGQKPLRIATGTEEEIRHIRKKMDSYVIPPQERLAAKMAARKNTSSKPASAA